MKNTTKSKTISHLKSTTALALLATLGICVMNTSFSNMAQAEEAAIHTEQNNEECKTMEHDCKPKNSFQLFIQSLMHRFFGSEDQNSAVHSEDKTGGGGGSSSTTPAAPSESTQSPQGETPSGDTGATNGTTGGSSGPSTESGTSTGQDGTGASMMQEPAPQTTSPPTTETPTGSDSSTTGGTIIKDKPTKTPLPTADVIIKTPQATEPVTTPAPTTLPPKDQTLVTPPLSQQAPPPPKESLTSGAVGNSTPTEGTQPQGTQTLPQAVIVQPQVLTATPFATFTPTTPPANLLDLSNNVVVIQNGELALVPTPPPAFNVVTVTTGDDGSKSPQTTHGYVPTVPEKEAAPGTTQPPATQPQGTQTLPQAVIVQPQVITATPFATFTPTTPAAPSSSTPLDLNSGVVINQNNQAVFLPSDPYKDVTLGGAKTETTDSTTSNAHGLGNFFNTFKEANPNQSGGTQTFPQAIIMQPQVLTALPYSTFTPTPSPESIEAERLILEGGQTTLILDRNDDTSTPPAANTTTYVNNTPAVGNPQAPSGTTMPLLDLNNANPVVTNGQLTINDTTTSTQPSSLAEWAAALGQFNGTVAGGTTPTTETVILPGGAITTTFSTPSSSPSFVVNGTSSTTFGTGSFAASNTLYDSNGQRIGIVTNAMPQILATSQSYKGFVYDSSGNVIGAYMTGLYFAYADGKWYQAMLNKVPVQYVGADPAMITKFFGTVPGTQIVTQERQASTPVKQSKPSTPSKSKQITDDSTDIVYIDEDSGNIERDSARDQGRTSPASTAPAVPVAPPPDDNF